MPAEASGPFQPPASASQPMGTVQSSPSGDTITIWQQTPPGLYSLNPVRVPSQAPLAMPNQMPAQSQPQQFTPRQLPPAYSQQPPVTPLRQEVRDVLDVYRAGGVEGIDRATAIRLLRGLGYNARDASELIAEEAPGGPNLPQQP